MTALNIDFEELTDEEKEEHLRHTHQYLTFILGGEEYGISILDINEIREQATLTRLPNQPAFNAGVINLRGSIIPVFSLKNKYTITTASKATTSSVIIVVNVNNRRIGIEADAVSDIKEIHDDSIKSAPTTACSIDGRCITGLVSDNNKIVILLNTENLLEDLTNKI